MKNDNARMEEAIRQRAAELSQNEAQLHDLIEGTSDLIHSVAQDGRFLFVNRAWRDTLGYTADEVAVLNIFDVVHVDSREQCRGVLRRVIDGERVGLVELSFQAKDGCAIMAEGSVHLWVEQGRPVSTYGIFRNVTVRTQAAEELRLAKFCMDRAGDAIYWLDRHARILQVNEAACAMLGYSKAELCAMTVHNINPSFPVDMWQAYWEETNQRGTTSIETCHQAKDGRLIPIEITVNPFSYDGQEYHCAFVRNITERKQHEEELYRLNETLGNRVQACTRELAAVNDTLLVEVAERKQVEAALRTMNARLDFLLSSSPATIYTCRAVPPYAATFISANVTGLLGYTVKDFLAMPGFWAEHIHPDDRDRVFAELPRLFIQGTHVHEYRFQHQDGSWRWMRDAMSVVPGPDGKAIELIGYFIDITARKQAEEALSEKEMRLRALFEQAAVGVAEIDTVTGRFIQVNLKDGDILGYSVEEMLTLDFMSITHPDDLASDLALMERLKRGELHEFTMEKRLLRKDGSIVWVDLTVSPLWKPGEAPIRHMAVVKDITAHKQVEDDLRRSETFITAVVDNLPLMVFVKDAVNLRFVWLNKAGEALLGYSHHDLLGKSSYDVFPKEEADFFVAADRKVLTDRLLLDIPEEPIQTKEHGIRILHTKKIPICDADGIPQFLLGISEDITEREQVENALCESEARLHGIIELAMDAIITVDEDQRVVVYNAMAEKVFGWAPSEIIGQPMDVLLPLHDRSRHSALVGAFAMAGSTSRRMGHLGQVTGLRASGEEFPAEASISQATIGGRIYCSVILRDITDRRRNEVALLARTRQQEAVAQLGLLALSKHDTDLVLDRAARLVTEVLEADFCKVMELLPPNDRFLLRAGTGWQEGMVGRAQVSAGLDSQAGYTLVCSAPVVVQDLRSDTRFSGPPLLHQHGVVSGISVVIYSKGRSWGVLGVHTTVLRLFSQDDINFLQAIANVLGATLERQGAEQALRQSELRLRASLDERERMELNLHDGVIQSLFAMSLTLQESQALISENSEAARTQIGKGLAVLNAVIRELRESIMGGVSVARSTSFQVTLTDLVEAAQGLRGLAFQVTLDPEALLRLTDEIEEHFLFIVREAVSNSQRHSCGTIGRVTLTTHDGGVRLVIEDNGQGFDRQRRSGHGLGLTNMAIRAEKLGARYDVVSDQGTGVRIQLDLPAQEG